MIFVIGASVGVKWFVQDEPGSDLAADLLLKFKNEPNRFVVPEIFLSELLSVLCRLTRKAELAQKYMENLQDLGFQRLENGRKTIEKACELAVDYQLGGYDAIYAANAFLIKGLWVTTDEKAHKKIKKLKISCTLSEFQNFYEA